MVRGVVQDQHQATSPSAMSQQMSKEAAETETVKLRLRLRDQLPLAEVDSSKQGHRLSGGRMEEHGVRLFRRHPHDGACPMLLEVAFIQTPQIHLRVTRQAVEFFYIEPAPPGQHGR